jgi:1-acyl-sn-glycerol-3-phosphate acyltransferase
MAKQEVYWWRVVRTGTCFAVFGIGALTLGLLVFPLLLLLVRDAGRRRSRARAIIHRSFRMFVALMHRVGGFTYEITGRERLGRPGQLIIANHPTLIDVVLIIGLTPAGCVVKEALFRNRYMRRVVEAAGYISNGSTPGMIEQASAALRAGDTLVMFPEGTRTRPGEPLAFHRGAASVALQAAGFLTPVYITTDPVFLPKNQPWYHVPRTRPHLRLAVGNDVDLAAYRDLPGPKASRMLNDWLIANYASVLHCDARYTEVPNAQSSRTTGTTASAQTTDTDRGVTPS